MKQLLFVDKVIQNIYTKDGSNTARTTYIGRSGIGITLWSYSISFPFRFNGCKVTWYGNPDSTFDPTPIINQWTISSENLSITRSADDKTAILNSSVRLNIGFRDFINLATIQLKGVLFGYGNGTSRGEWNVTHHGLVVTS